MGKDYRLLKDYCELNKIDIRLNEPMSAHTSLRIGGPADFLIIPEQNFLFDIIEILEKSEIPYTIIGRGTNILFKDSGIEGAVILTKKIDKIDKLKDDEISVQAGCSLKKIINFCSDLGLSGMEGLAGIPGSIGGAIAGNAGSFGFEIKDVLKSVDLLMPNLEIKILDASEIEFSYRKSVLPDNSIIIRAMLKLKQGDPYSIKKLVREYAKQKSLKQPISKRSAGCVFKNPAGVSAGELIDKAGCKGMRVGDIEVSRIHANFFINLGSGTADDFLRLMDIVVKKVNSYSGIVLEPEIKILGNGHRRFL
jgi:UDP-N-acetylmuramate dehydrogenase